MKYLIAVAFVIGLSACTAEQAYRTAAEIGEASREVIEEKILVRQEYRSKQRDIINTMYKIEMSAADRAERGGKLEEARTHWEAAWMILETHMPTHEGLREKIRNFLGPRTIDVDVPLLPE